MGNYWLDQCKKDENKKKFKGKFQEANAINTGGPVYPRPSKRSLKEKIDIGSMTEKALDEIRTFLIDAMITYTESNK